MAQDTTQNKLEISGSADIYYKYDLSGRKAGNIQTVFADENNSFSIGMIDIGLKENTSKASFVAEFAFGPRGQYESIPDVITPSGQRESYHIQNLYLNYDFTDKLSVTGGYMATFIGYEGVSAANNFNYSTSYLNTNGPFQNAGIKATYAFSDKVSLLMGLFNDYYNVFQSKNDISTFGTQLALTPVNGLVIYLNFASGYASGRTLDVSATYQVAEALKLGINATDFKSTMYLGTGGYGGVAAYSQYKFTKTVALGLRGEYYSAKNGTLTLPGPLPGGNVTGITVSANIKAGPLTLIPEFRHDAASDNLFFNGDGMPTKSASQVLLAAVYSF